ncbi:MAG: hypothetical protein WD071_06780 [Pseudohongiella sp.]|uniref:hypothetical protein n=1 Tax=Pseudohongiella sp. TaxID=1979412 RepID=UPI0034A07319
MSNTDTPDPFKDEVENIVSKAIFSLAEGLTGVAASDRGELLVSLGHAFQRMRGGEFLSSFQVEWNSFRKKGKIKDDYQFTEQGKVCLQELLNFLDNDSPSEERFKLLQSIFIVAASEGISSRDSFLPAQLMKISRSLSDGEIVLLSSIWGAFKAGKHNGKSTHFSANEWINEITNLSPIEHRELVEIYEQGLMEKKLITPRAHGDNSGVYVKPYYRLSSLGYKLCEFIEQYDVQGGK